ncbi:phosphotransferase family protein, partial [Rodentibacter caecimuris]|uniref:phosphotransferase family protein n=1 Tax=Rodentibacter caecimuris TaxID=1796644 RepID=UPI0015C3721F
FNDTIDKIVCFFYKVIDCLDYKYKKLPLVPCHNDLVPENILISDNKTYFIDWEYSGMNYPLFDISALFLESNLDYFQQKDFLRYYNNSINLDDIYLDIMMFQFTQDTLWFLWTIIKEENNEDFGNYAKMRIDRAYKTMQNILTK